MQFVYQYNMFYTLGMICHPTRLVSALLGIVTSSLPKDFALDISRRYCILNLIGLVLAIPILAYWVWGKNDTDSSQFWSQRIFFWLSVWLVFHTIVETIAIVRISVGIKDLNKINTAGRAANIMNMM